MSGRPINSSTVYDLIGIERGKCLSFSRCCWPISHKQDSHTLQRVRGTEAVIRPCARRLQLSPAEVVDQVKASALRGRGGAGFPTGLKWTFLPQDHPGPIYFCLNADESEPGTFNNRILMEDDPHQVLEGLIISCFATRATTAYIYLRCEYPLAYQRLQTAIDECYAAGYLGPESLGHGTTPSTSICTGEPPPTSVAKRPGLIESLEGKRAWPRIKPPFPAVEGLFRKPTVVNNVETVACVKHIIERGVDWFRSIGVPPDPDNPRDAGSFGPKLYCLSGTCATAGLLRSPTGDHRPRADRSLWRRRLEGTSGQGGHPRRNQHGRAGTGRIGLSAGFQWARAVRLPRIGNGGGRRDGRYGLDGRLPAQQCASSSPTKVADSARPVAKGTAWA